MTDEPAALCRAVACIAPPRLGRESRAAELARGLLFVAAWAGVACAAGLVIGAFTARPRVIHCFPESEGDLAKATVLKYAFEAYPTWRQQHSELCPSRLEELNEYMNNKDIRDPWGGIYVMSCDATRLLVWSAGEDGTAGTDDDVRSDR